jgi:cytochrome P450
MTTCASTEPEQPSDLQALPGTPPDLQRSLPPLQGLRVEAARQTLRWLSRPYALLSECAASFGDAFTLDFGAHGAYAMFAAPEAIRAIFTADAATAHAGAGNGVLLPLLGPSSLLLLEEQRHQRERRLLLPSFHARRVEAYGGLTQGAARAALDRFEPGQEVVIHHVTQEIALRVILRSVLGKGGGETEALGRELFAFLNDPRLTLANVDMLREDVANETWRGFQRQLAHIDDLIRSEIARRRSATEAGGDDVMSVLLAARYEDGAALSDAALRDELMTLLITGYETTATALAWALHWISADPAVGIRLREEIGALGGPAAAPAALSDRAPYLHAACLETLRICPIVPMVARRLTKPLCIQGHALPEGITVAAVIYLAHHRPSVFPDPARFSPERFLGREYSPYEYLPFGGGPRRCLGSALALFEMKVILGTILACCELSPAGPPVHPVRRSVTIAPSGGARARVLRRLDAQGSAR